jgi:hypothetical protein
MKQRLQLFIVVILTFYACDEQKSDSKQMNLEYETTLIDLDSSKTTTTSNYKGLKLLKSIVDQENSTIKSNSIKFSDTKTIGDFLFIRDLFPTKDIDSIEFYGTYDKQEVYSKNIPENSVLIIYFNHKQLSKNRMNLLEFEWNPNFKAAQAVFETGSIVFEIDNQLCVYSINNCNESNKEIERIDSILKKELNQNLYQFERISTDCGKVSFSRKLN